MQDTFIPPLQGAVTTGTSITKMPVLEQNDKGEMTLEELIRQYRQDKSRQKSWDSESSSCFVSSEEDNNYNYGPDDDAKKEYIPLYRKEHGGIIIYDCEGIIPGQPSPAYDDSDYEIVESKVKPESNKNINYCQNIDEYDQEISSQDNKDIKILSPVIDRKNIGSNRWKSVTFEDNLTADEDAMINEFERAAIKQRTNQFKLKDRKEENSHNLNLINLDKNLICRCHSELNINSPMDLIWDDEIFKLKSKSKKIEKIYGVNETPPDLRILNKRPKFSQDFQSQIISRITPKRRYGNPNHSFTLKMPPEEELKVRFESRFENGNLK